MAYRSTLLAGVVAVSATIACAQTPTVTTPPVPPSVTAAPTDGFLVSSGGQTYVAPTSQVAGYVATYMGAAINNQVTSDVNTFSSSLATQVSAAQTSAAAALASANLAKTYAAALQSGGINASSILNSTITGGSATGTDVSQAVIGVGGQTVSALATQSASTVTALANKATLVHSPVVFMGGTYNFQDIASNVASSLASGKVGLYEHANGLSALTSAQRTAIQATWGPTGASIVTGGGTGVGEIGTFTPAQTAGSYVGFFGGSYPAEINMNYGSSGVGSGTYTAASPDANPGTTYGCYMQASDLTTVKAGIQTAIQYGAKNVAPVATPNCGSEDITDPFATAAFWANVRAAALYGGGIALDVPPTYAVYVRTPAYVAFVAQMIEWANANHIRSSLVLSPYATSADAAGQSLGNGFDSTFLSNTQALIGMLRSDGALPTQFVVENYAGVAGADPNYPAGDGVAGSLNMVADFLADIISTAPGGTATPGATGGTSEASIQPVLTSINPLGSDLGGLGLGDLAGQNSSNANIIGGMFGSLGNGAPPLNIQLNPNSSMFVQGSIGFQGGGSGGNPTMAGSSTDGFIHLGEFAGSSNPGFVMNGSTVQGYQTDPNSLPMVSFNHDIQVVGTIFNGNGVAYVAGGGAGGNVAAATPSTAGTVPNLGGVSGAAVLNGSSQLLASEIPFGTASGSVMQGNDSRVVSALQPSALTPYSTTTATNTAITSALSGYESTSALSSTFGSCVPTSGAFPASCLANAPSGTNGNVTAANIATAENANASASTLMSKAAGANAVARTLSQQRSDATYASDYGMACDGTIRTTNTSASPPVYSDDDAFDNAEAAAVARLTDTGASTAGAQLVLPPGHCRLTRAHDYTVTKPLALTGAGMGMTLIETASTTDGIVLSTTNSSNITINGLKLERTAGTLPSGTLFAGIGVGVLGTASGTGNKDAITNVEVFGSVEGGAGETDGWTDCIKMTDATNWTIDNDVTYNPTPPLALAQMTGSVAASVAAGATTLTVAGLSQAPYVPEMVSDTATGAVLGTLSGTQTATTLNLTAASTSTAIATTTATLGTVPASGAKVLTVTGGGAAVAGQVVTDATSGIVLGTLTGAQTATTLTFIDAMAGIGSMHANDALTISDGISVYLPSPWPSTAALPAAVGHNVATGIDIEGGGGQYAIDGTVEGATTSAGIVGLDISDFQGAYISDSRFVYADYGFRADTPGTDSELITLANIHSNSRVAGLYFNGVGPQLSNAYLFDFSGSNGFGFAPNFTFIQLTGTGGSVGMSSMAGNAGQVNLVGNPQLATPETGIWVQQNGSFPVTETGNTFVYMNGPSLGNDGSNSTINISGTGNSIANTADGYAPIQDGTKNAGSPFGSNGYANNIINDNADILDDGTGSNIAFRQNVTLGTYAAGAGKLVVQKENSSAVISGQITLDSSTGNVTAAGTVTAPTVAATGPVQSYTTYMGTNTGHLTQTFNEQLYSSAGTLSTNGSAAGTGNLGPLQTGNVHVSAKVSCINGSSYASWTATGIWGGATFASVAATFAATPDPGTTIPSGWTLTASALAAASPTTSGYPELVLAGAPANTDCTAHVEETNVQ